MTGSFGDVTGEYLALRRGAGVVAGGHEIVWVSGSDTVPFLDGLLSQSITHISTGEAARSLLLSPQGKLRATLWALRSEDRVGLVADAGRGDVVREDLTRFKIRVDVDLASDERQMLELWGSGSGEVLEQSGLPNPERGRWVEAADVLVASLPFSRVGLPRYVVAGGDAESLVAAGATRSGTLAATAVRIEAGEPVTGVDVDEGTIPQEGGLVDGAVDFAKGCYLGQELVARIDSRGRVNRHLRGLIIAENVLPPAGAEVRLGDRTVGTLSSVAESLELRAPIAMGLLRREAEPGDAVVVRWQGGETSARVADLPLDPTL